MTASVQVEAAKNRIIDDYTEYNIYKAWGAIVEYNRIYPAIDSHTGEKIATGNRNFDHTFHFY